MCRALPAHTLPAHLALLRTLNASLRLNPAQPSPSPWEGSEDRAARTRLAKLPERGRAAFSGAVVPLLLSKVSLNYSDPVEPNTCRPAPSVNGPQEDPHPQTKPGSQVYGLPERFPWVCLGLRKDRHLGINLSHSLNPLGFTSDSFLLRGWHHQTGAGRTLPGGGMAGSEGFGMCGSEEETTFPRVNSLPAKGAEGQVCRHLSGALQSHPLCPHSHSRSCSLSLPSQALQLPIAGAERGMRCWEGCQEGT